MIFAEKGMCFMKHLRGRNHNDDSVLQRVNDYLGSTEIAPSNFSGTFMILAEWNDVHPYPHGSCYCSCIILLNQKFHQPGSYSAAMYVKLMIRLLLDKIYQCMKFMKL